MKSTILAIVVCSAISTNAFGQSTDNELFRTWTDVFGNRIKAEFAGVQGDQVLLKINGQPARPFPKTGFVATDRRWIKAHEKDVIPQDEPPATGQPGMGSPGSGFPGTGFPGSGSSGSSGMPSMPNGPGMPGFPGSSGGSSSSGNIPPGFPGASGNSGHDSGGGYSSGGSGGYSSGEHDAGSSGGYGMGSTGPGNMNPGLMNPGNMNPGYQPPGSSFSGGVDPMPGEFGSDGGFGSHDPSASSGFPSGNSGGFAPPSFEPPAPPQMPDIPQFEWVFQCDNCGAEFDSSSGLKQGDACPNCSGSHTSGTSVRSTGRMIRGVIGLFALIASGIGWAIRKATT
ncbi:MAG: hypothetical protein KDA91_04820 [Planctomycetaceae bacterium]|nr:hypothetical protein [Planctomycetaceae bacterium]